MNSTMKARINGIPEFAGKADLVNLLTAFAGLDGSATWDAGSIADGDEEVKEVTVPGAKFGDFVMASLSRDVTDLSVVAAITAADTVTVQLLNNTGGAIDLASATVYVRVLPR